MKQTLKVWTTVKTMLRVPEWLARVIPMVGIIEFPPSSWDGGFRRWANKGLSTIKQLFGETELKSISQLQEQFSLPLKDLYRYLKRRHYITSHKKGKCQQKSK